MKRKKPTLARRLMAACVLAPALVAAACITNQATDESVGVRTSRLDPVRDSYFYRRGAPVRLTLVTNQVGISVAERTPRAQVDALASGSGLTVAQELPGRLFLLQGPTATRADLFKRARAVKTKGQGVVRDAGIVARAEGESDVRVVNDEVLVKFNPGTTEAQISAALTRYQLEIARRSRVEPLRLRARLKPGASQDSLAAANLLQASGLVSFAHPNFYVLYQRNETTPDDPLYPQQWPHANVDPPDADADTNKAWDLTLGSDSVVIAVVDNAFALDNPDLAARVAESTDGIGGGDEDLNGYTDDFRGWDFVGNDNDVSPASAYDNHGTAVAGVAVAEANNGQGISGVCPGCKFLPLSVLSGCGRLTGCMGSVADFADAFDYAVAREADIINLSLGTGHGSTPVEDGQAEAVDTAVRAGKVVVVAQGNFDSDGYCAVGFPSLPGVISVGGSNSSDAHMGFGYGDCMELVAPTWSSDTLIPTLPVPATDRRGSDGYNNLDVSCPSGTADFTNRDYTRCFSGTSAAAPMVSGAAGLLLSLDPGLTAEEVRRALIDTADKIEPSFGSYLPETGFSTPVERSSRLGFGRLNVFEAVQLIASPARGGKGEVDVVLRDNAWDWGNTEQRSGTLFDTPRSYAGHWLSPDIKIDAPPYDSVPTDNEEFERLADESPKPGELNRVYVRLRNRGPVMALNTAIKLHWAHYGAALPVLPADFWSTFPLDSSDTTDWHPLGLVRVFGLASSGSSLAGCRLRRPDCAWEDEDVAGIARFEFPGPTLEPGTPNHYCLLAVADSTQDGVSPRSRSLRVVDDITPWDNNVTHKNVVLDTSLARTAEQTMFVRNPFPTTAKVKLQVTAPQGWQVGVSGVPSGTFAMTGFQKVLARVTVTRPTATPGEVHVVEEILTGNHVTHGGALLRFQ